MNKARKITHNQIQKYIAYLTEQERSAATIGKYIHELNALVSFLGGELVKKL